MVRARLLIPHRGMGAGKSTSIRDFCTTVSDRGRVRVSTSRRRRKQSLLYNHQIGQSKQRMELCRVLVQAAIAQLLMVEAVLDDVEGMLDHGAHLCQRSLDRLRQLAQGLR